MEDPNPAKAFARLISIVDTLMGENGCPWDKVQTRETLKPYLVEEAYETLAESVPSASRARSQRSRETASSGRSVRTR